MPDLLLEVGCEELPASFVTTACEDLRDQIVRRLGEAGLSGEQPEVYGTPRRIIVSLKGVPARQEDADKISRGPAKQAAYDAEGNPTKALEGFCRGQGVDPSTAYEDGDYVWVKKRVEGRATASVLEEILPASITALSFAKTMRWGSHRLRFARPIRWILATFDGKVVPFSVESVVSGKTSRGHRFNYPEPFEAATINELLEGLRAREVEPNGHYRAALIRKGVTTVSHGRAILDEKLVEENAYLTEWPTAVLGTFDPKYLSLPEPVLVTVMAKHERFFPVRDTEGKLTNNFVSIRNGGVDEVVAQGNAWVLNARFNDAKFFFDEDQKHSFDEFLEKTSGIVFQVELGTVRERADRLERLCGEIAQSTGASDEEIGFAELAGRYAKADLSTGLVGELDELQGVIGGIYARREGLPEAVCWAIDKQYMVSREGASHSAGAGSWSSEMRTCLRLCIADQLDKLAGYLGLGLVPTGSSDPFGLRRAAALAMSSALSWSESAPDVGSATTSETEIELASLLSFATSCYGLDLKDPIPAAREIFRQRCETLFPNVRQDVLDAVLADEDLVFTPAALQQRLGIMEKLAKDIPFVQAATRPLNIIAAAEKKGIASVALDETKLDSSEASKLLKSVREMPAHLDLKALQKPIDAFFDSTMVMVEDEAVRDARLAMLREVCSVLLKVGDFSKLVIAG